MVLQIVQCLASSLVQQVEGQMMVLCLAWSSVQTMERHMVHYLAMLLLLYCLDRLMMLLLKADGDSDDGALFGMELGADNGTSHGTLLGHVTVVILLGSADDATVESGW